MKKIILPLAIGLALVSCSRDNDTPKTPQPPAVTPNQQPVLLSKMHSSIEGSTIFTYEGDKIKSMKYVDKDDPTDTSTVFYTYTGDKITSITDTSGDVTHYEYNPDGTLAKSTYIENAPNRKYLFVMTYQYLNKGNTVIVQKSRVEERTNKSDPNGSITYTLENGNITKSVDIYINPENQNNYLTITREITYDKANNPLMNIKGFPALVFEFYYYENTDIIIGKNNEILSKEKREEKDGLGGTRITETIYNATYQYNDKNYPTSLSSKQNTTTNGKKEPEQLGTITFDY